MTTKYPTQKELESYRCGAAEFLGIKPTTLASRIKAMGIAKQFLQ